MDKKKILIVDDDEDLLLGLKIRLEANQYATASANDADSAVHVALKERPDVILLDVGLPEDNGFMVMQKLQKLDSLKSIPVVIVSGRPAHLYKNAALLAGAKGYLEKPIDNAALLTTVETVLKDAESTGGCAASKQLANPGRKGNG
jgi:DNA-binding response OmpR family regulator